MQLDASLCQCLFAGGADIAFISNQQPPNGIDHIPQCLPFNQSLYERLGGVVKIASIVDNLVDRVKMDPIIRADPLIVEADAKFPKPVTKFQVTLLLCEVAGGPYTYAGRTLKDSHKHLNITPREWEVFVADVTVALDYNEVGEQEKQEVLAIVQSTRTDCVADEYLKQ